MTTSDLPSITAIRCLPGTPGLDRDFRNFSIASARFANSISQPGGRELSVARGLARRKLPRERFPRRDRRSYFFAAENLRRSERAVPAARIEGILADKFRPGGPCATESRAAQVVRSNQKLRVEDRPLRVGAPRSVRELCQVALPCRDRLGKVLRPLRIKDLEGRVHRQSALSRGASGESTSPARCFKN